MTGIAILAAESPSLCRGIGRSMKNLAKHILKKLRD